MPSEFKSQRLVASFISLAHFLLLIVVTLYLPFIYIWQCDPLLNPISGHDLDTLDECPIKKYISSQTCIKTTEKNSITFFIIILYLVCLTVAKRFHDDIRIQAKSHSTKLFDIFQHTLHKFCCETSILIFGFDIPCIFLTPKFNLVILIMVQFLK